MWSERFCSGSITRTISTCGCLPECWCKRTGVGRLVKWWFPARWFGLRHKNAFFDGMTTEEIRAWKREQEQKGMSSMVVQPEYEKIARLVPMRFGLTVRLNDGSVAVHELGGARPPQA